MKFNLPSVWTWKKIQTLIFLTILNSSSVQGGSELSKCLGGNDLLYNTLVPFSNGIPERDFFCCSSCEKRCIPNSPSLTCPVCANGNHCFLCGNIDIYAQCSQIGQSEFCVTRGYSEFTLPGDICGGVTINTPLTNVMIGKCPDLKGVENSLNDKQSVPPNFSWLCCNNNNCMVPTGVTVDAITKTANTNCPLGQYSLMCFLDNGGWSCTGSVANYLNLTQPIGDCVMQLVLPNLNPTTKEPSTSETSTTTSSDKSSSTYPTNSGDKNCTIIVNNSNNSINGPNTHDGDIECINSVINHNKPSNFLTSTIIFFGLLFHLL